MTIIGILLLIIGFAVIKEHPLAGTGLLIFGAAFLSAVAA